MFCAYKNNRKRLNISNKESTDNHNPDYVKPMLQQS